MFAWRSATYYIRLRHSAHGVSAYDTCSVSGAVRWGVFAAVLEALQEEEGPRREESPPTRGASPRD